MKSYNVKDSNYKPIKGKWVRLDIIKGMTPPKDPVIHKSELDRAFKEQLKDVVRKSDLNKAFKEQLKDVVRQKDLDKALKDFVRKKDLAKALQPIYKHLGININ